MDDCIPFKIEWKKEYTMALICVLKTAIVSGPLLLCSGLNINCTNDLKLHLMDSPSKSNNVDQNI